MNAARNPEVLGLRVSSKRLPPAVANALRRFFNRLFGFERFNRIYRELPPCEPFEFSRVLLEALGVRLELLGESIEIVPRAGPLMVVANHPFGIIEGAALDVLLGTRRPDGAVMAIHELGAIPEYQGRLILVGQRGRRSRRRHSHTGWREAFVRLKRGGSFAVFPAGGVARYQWRRRAVADPPWSPHVAALARRSHASVLPVFFHGRRGIFFQAIGLVSPSLQNLLIMGQLGSLRGRTLRIVIGPLISPKELASFASDEEAIEFLRERTEALASPSARPRVSGDPESYARAGFPLSRE